MAGKWLNTIKVLGWIEKYGSGIQRIIESFKTAHLPIPRFKEMSAGIRVTVFGEVTTDKVIDNQSKMLLKMSENPAITTNELAQSIGISQRKIKENIKKFKEMNRIQRFGNEKTSHWKGINKHVHLKY